MVAHSAFTVNLRRVYALTIYPDERDRRVDCTASPAICRYHKSQCKLRSYFVYFVVRLCSLNQELFVRMIRRKLVPARASCAIESRSGLALVAYITSTAATPGCATHPVSAKSCGVLNS